MTKAARHHLICSLLSSDQCEITNQDQLLCAMADRGVHVAQPTLSRDLREIGVLKGPAGYELLHLARESTLPTLETPTKPASKSQADTPSSTASTLPPALLRSVRSFVTSVEQGESIVVVRTVPAAAQAVAAALDQAKLDAVVGTVAGDDTIFLACKSSHDATRVRTTLAHAVGITPVPNRARA